LDRFLDIFKSSEHRWIIWVLLATGIALSIALLTGYIRIIDVLFHSFIEIKFWKLIFLTPIFILFLNVACDLKLNPLLIDLCFFLSKSLIKALYYVVGFLVALLLANLIFGHMNHAAFFAITGFTTYFIALATHWMVLDLESQSRDLCIETYC
jgi:E3 ubiquitin-protein ligase DOA10